MDSERPSVSSDATRSAQRASMRALTAEQRLLRALSLWDDMQALRAAFVGVIPAASARSAAAPPHSAPPRR